MLEVWTDKPITYHSTRKSVTIVSTHRSSLAPVSGTIFDHDIMWAFRLSKYFQKNPPPFSQSNACSFGDVVTGRAHLNNGIWLNSQDNVNNLAQILLGTILSSQDIGRVHMQTYTLVSLLYSRRTWEFILQDTWTQIQANAWEEPVCK